MPMRESERKLYEQEADVRPNRYVAIAMAVLSFLVIGILLVNELGFFREDKTRMRIAMFAALIMLEIPQFMCATDAGLRNSKTKYFMILCTAITVAIVCSILNLHATLVLFIPLLIAAQYPSVKISRLATVCSIVCAFFCPILNYLLGMWDTAFVTWLCRVGGQIITIDGAVPDDEKITIYKIILYLSVPHSLIILATFPLSIAISRSGEEKLHNQIQVLHMSESDVMTGLLNRQSFEKAMTIPADPEDGNVAVVYVDANDLHRMNNEQGHLAGDKMLICISDSLRFVFGDECAYRIGGDEFVAIAHGLTLTEASVLVKQVRARVEQYGYTISVGIEYAQPPCSLQTIVNSADTKMMIDKKRYHITR